MEWQIIGAAFAVVCGLVGVIFWLGQTRDDKQDSRATIDEQALKEHVREDIRAHERLTAVETKVEALQTEVRAIRDMRHDIIQHVAQSLASWYAKVVEMIEQRRK